MFNTAYRVAAREPGLFAMRILRGSLQNPDGPEIFGFPPTKISQAQWPIFRQAQADFCKCQIFESRRSMHIQIAHTRREYREVGTRRLGRDNVHIDMNWR